MNRYIPSKEANIRICGRTVQADPLPLFWTASGVEFITDGTFAAFELESDHSGKEQWIRVELDGFSILRMPLSKGKQTVTVFDGAAAGNPHHVHLYKEVQPMGDDHHAKLLLHSVLTDGALLPLPEKKHRLQIIGDSITSGEGLAGAKDFDDWISCVFSCHHSYALQTADALEAEISIVSQSGWGVLCGWDANPDSNLPRVYDLTCGPIAETVNGPLGATAPWRFDAWQPDAVIINLCTNDDNSFNSPAFTCPDGRTFVMQRGNDGHYDPDCAGRVSNAVRSFLKHLRGCNPGAYLLWCYGIYESKVPGEMMSLLQQAVNTYRSESGDMNCGLLPLPSIQPDQFGSRGHPGPASHDAAAQVIIEHLRPILNAGE